MFWKRKDEAKLRTKIAVCYADSDMTRAAADWLAQQGLCESVAILADTPKDALWLCQREKPDLLILEAVPDAMERFDDPDKDIAGRCELSARITEVLPDCRVYLVCDEQFGHLEPVMQKAVGTNLIHGYCFGSLTRPIIESWLSETEPHRL